MRNILDESCRKNQNTHFTFSTFFPKIVPFMRKCRKIWCSQEDRKWRHSMAHTRCMLNKQGYVNARTRTRAHPRTRARAHTHIIPIAFRQQQLFANAPQYYVILHCIYCWLYCSLCIQLQQSIHPLKDVTLYIISFVARVKYELK